MYQTKLLAEMEIIAQMGAEQASSALSRFLGVSISLTVSDVSIQEICVIPEKLGSSEFPSIGLISRITGDINGNSALLFDLADAEEIITILSGRLGLKGKEKLQSMQTSMLEETANITISSFMNSMTAHLNKKCIPNAPIYLKDLSGTIISLLLIENAEASDIAIVFSTTFNCLDGNLKALFIFLPNPTSLMILQEDLSDALNK